MSSMRIARRRVDSHNYALANRRGFSSAIATRTKKRVKGRAATTTPASAPSSPVKEGPTYTPELDVNHLSNILEKAMGKGKKGTKKGSVQASSKKSNKSESVHMSPRGESPDVTNTGDSISPVLVLDLTMSELDGLSLAEKKKRVQQQIQELEAEVNEQPEMDDELRELLRKQDALKKRVEEKRSTPTPSTSKLRNTGKAKGKKGIITDGSESSDVVNEVDDSIESKINQAIGSSMPSLAQIKDLLLVTDKKPKAKMSKRSKKRRHNRRRHDTSESESEQSSSDSSSESDESSDEDRRRKKRGKEEKSGLYRKPGHVNNLSRETFAHTALDDEIGERDLYSLSFNLLVAGELEILTSKGIGKEEKGSRLEVLKKLAYKAEYLPQDEIILQYISFIRKVEKGKYRWGSRADLCLFDQQLVYSISVNAKKQEAKVRKQLKLDDRKKYCLDYNRGKCQQDKGHEGKLNGVTVFKLHVCKFCLAKEGLEESHPGIQCPKYK